MRKLKIIEHISLDGLIQHAAADGDFPYSDRIAPYRGPAGLDAMLATPGGILVDEMGTSARWHIGLPRLPDRVSRFPNPDPTLVNHRVEDVFFAHCRDVSSPAGR